MRKLTKKDIAIELQKLHGNTPAFWNNIVSDIFLIMYTHILLGDSVDLYRIGKIVPRNFTNKKLRDPLKNSTKIMDKWTKVSFHTAQTLKKELNKDSKEIGRIIR